MGSATFPGLVVADASGFSPLLAGVAVALGYAGGVERAGRAGRGPSEATAIAWARRYPRSASSNLFVRSHTRARLLSVLARSGWRDPRLSSCMAAASRNSRSASK